MAEPVPVDRCTVELLRNPTRMRILQAARTASTARQIATFVRVPVTRVYHHLDLLSAAGLIGVVGARKEGASVTRMFQARFTDVSGTADLDQLAGVLQDAVADARAAGPGPGRLGGRTIAALPAGAIDRVIAAVQRIVDDIDAATDPDGDLVGFTYLVAPVRRPESVPEYRIRPGTAADLPTYRRILYEAISWNPTRTLPPMDQALAHPQLLPYHRGWGRPGDLAVIATLHSDAGDSVVGGAFCRLFTADDLVNSFVDEQTPDVAIAVWPEHRGRGVGARLLAALADAALTAGTVKLSLNVERQNPAANVYQRCGFTIVSEQGNDYLMVADLG